MPGRVGLQPKSYENPAQLEEGISRQILQNPKRAQLRTAALRLEEPPRLSLMVDVDPRLRVLIQPCCLIPV